ncbi:hypothetical protein [Rhizobium tubonense]|uniref:Uncharacterized protein n=1 Tax=Rhizobium tubonense TaxID=484088 RepID=A0A2W4CPJ4_9HYPH|nr:hypothetical protein [Rhizobium tubonense]PZM14612.1 hypothetical protein CPY51_10250 [Rhizobium tubonense]
MSDKSNRALAKKLLDSGQLDHPQMALAVLMANTGNDAGKALRLCGEACAQAANLPCRDIAFRALSRVGAFLEDGEPL